LSAAAREAFDQAVGVGELVGHFRAFMPPLACLHLAEVTASHDGENRSNGGRQLEGFRQYATDAFNGTITQADLEYLHQTASDLANGDGADLASAIDFFVDRLKEEIERRQIFICCSFLR
jgi:hypothetical protein